MKDSYFRFATGTWRAGIVWSTRTGSPSWPTLEWRGPCTRTIITGSSAKVGPAMSSQRKPRAHFVFGSLGFLISSRRTSRRRRRNANQSSNAGLCLADKEWLHGPIISVHPPRTRVRFKLSQHCRSIVADVEAMKKSTERRKRVAKENLPRST